MITTQKWETIYEWNSDHWNNDGEWTAEKMTEELDALEDFRRSKLSKQFQLLDRLVNDIQIGINIRDKNIEYDFSVLNQLFSLWDHFTITCANYGREWVAQDESYLKCFKGHDCNGSKRSCSEYKTMVKGPSLEELVKNSSKMVVQFT
jgi:hypothetical protein